MHRRPQGPRSLSVGRGIVLAALALVSGCAELFGPGAGPAVFVLRSIDEHALPAVVEGGSFSTLYLDADYFIVTSTGTATWVRHERLELDAGGPILRRSESTVVLLPSGSGFRMSSLPPCVHTPTCVDQIAVRPAQLPNEFSVRGEGGSRLYRRDASAY